MFQWEVATAVAGSVIGIDAFNQPDVEASKISDARFDRGIRKDGLAAGGTADPRAGRPPVFHGSNQQGCPEKTVESTLGGLLRAHLDRIKTGDYFALLAYIPMFPEHEAKLEEIRKEILESKQVATVLGFGPRFLHSTGQAYKGGPNPGVFVQITCDEAQDIPVPEQKYTFGIVKAAQARGDFQVLAERHRRALRVHLGKDVGKGLNQLATLISAALAH